MPFCMQGFLQKGIIGLNAKKKQIKTEKEMKKMKYLLLVAVCLIATNVMTSCLNDGDDFDYSMTQEEVNAYLTRLSGTYTGKMYFVYRGRNKAGTADSAIVDSIQNMTWRFNRDSTMTIANFPDSVYNNAIKGNNDVRKILKQASKRQLNCYYAPYKGKDMTGAADYGFYIIAKSDTEGSNNNYVYTKSEITADGKSYTAKYGYTSYIADGYTRIDATGYQSKDGKNIEFSLLVGKVECNNVESFTSEGYRVRFVGEKLY